MRTYRELSIKNRPEYIFDNMTNIKRLDTNLVSVNQLSFINDDALDYEIEYSKDCNDAYPLYLVFNDVDVYFSCVDGEKYLVFASADRNEEVLENYKKFWDGVKEEIRTIKGGIEPFEYENNYMRIRSESENGLPLNRVLNIPACVIIVRSVFEDNGKFYPQVYLNCCLEYDHSYDFYICPKTPLKYMNNSEYGKFLSKKRVVNLVTTDFNSLQMVTKQLNIKNRTYYFWNDLINIKNFDPALLKLDKNSSIGANIYCIGHVANKSEYNVNSVNPSYLVTGEIDGFIEEENGRKYLNIALTDSNSEVLKKYA